MRKAVLVLSFVIVGALLLTSGMAAGEEAQSLYDKKCAMCHGKDGVAKTMADGAADLNDPEWQEANSADDIAKVNELHIEEGKLYHYKLESRDVLHNFSVPIFRLKQDAIPGRVITGWFTPTLTGTWDVQCAEICGIGHGVMGARIVIESSERHAAWVAEQGSITLAAAHQP